MTVIGSIASGADVIAGGSIHIYGTARGRVMAGAYGDARARIFCRRLEAELIGVNGFYMTAEEIDAKSAGSGGPSLVRRRDNQNCKVRLKGRHMAKVVVVTSGKGGVGKTTSTAALGTALAQSGQKVVVADFDIGLRNLDLVMGAERRVVYDLINVAQGDAKLHQALIRDKQLENLFLLPASQTRDKDALTEDGVRRVIDEMREQFDWIICDSPAGIERGATLAMRFADIAIIVANAEVSSVRDSDRIIGLLDAKTERAEKGEHLEKHLLLTRYDARRVAHSEMLSVDDVLEILSIPLLGIVPESEEVLRASNLGSPVTLHNPASAPARAYIEAAQRLRGLNIALNIPMEKKNFLGRFFGRRAA